MKTNWKFRLNGAQRFPRNNDTEHLYLTFQIKAYSDTDVTIHVQKKNHRSRQGGKNMLLTSVKCQAVLQNFIAIFNVRRQFDHYLKDPERKNMWCKNFIISPGYLLIIKKTLECKGNVHTNWCLLWITRFECPGGESQLGIK